MNMSINSHMFIHELPKADDAEILHLVENGGLSHYFVGVSTIPNWWCGGFRWPIHSISYNDDYIKLH